MLMCLWLVIMGLPDVAHIIAYQTFSPYWLFFILLSSVIPLIVLD